MDMLVGADASPAEVSDKIKEILYAKSSSKIDAIRPDIGAALFGDEVDDETDETDEVVDELEYDPCPRSLTQKDHVESEEDEEEEIQTGDEDVD